MKGVASESWAKHNHRLQQFIQEQIQKAPKSTKTPTDSSSRLGFGHHRYSKVDLAGTNEVVNGLYLSDV